MTRYFIDTEFVESKHALITPPILLISIGIVAEDGREYYAQDDYMGAVGFEQYPWIRDNVWPHLTEDAWKDRATIRREIEEFVNAGAGKPEFWGWCAGYDFVVLCQLFGGMLELPTGWPHYIRDLQHLLDAHRLTDDMLPPQIDQVHNALADARYLQQLWRYLAQWPHPPLAALKKHGWPGWEETRMGSRERLKHQEHVSHRQPFYWEVAKEPLTIDLQAAGEAPLFRSEFWGSELGQQIERETKQ